MKRIFHAAILIALAALCLPAQTLDNSQPKGSISGTVWDSATEQPIRGATVSLRSRGARPTSNPSATTNAEGEFILEGVTPGRYTIFASHDGYVNERGTGSGLSRQLILVGTGERVANLKLRLSPGAVITGIVTDAAGTPLRAAAVEAMKRSYRHGQIELTSVTSVSTNSAGEYRIENLPAGSYYIRASYAGSPAVKPKDEVYVPLYYPASSDAEHSVALSVREGEQLSAIEIHLLPVRAFRVKGIALNGTTSLPAKGAHLVLVGDQGKQTFTLKDPAVGPTGVFEFHGVPSGSYLLAADLAPSPGAGKTLFARVPIQVANLNVNNVDVVLMPGAEIVGRMRSEGKVNVDLSRFVVEMQPHDPLAAVAMPDPPSTQVSADGTFAVRDLPDGTYSVNFLPVPAGFYLNANGNDVFESGITVARGATPAPLDITIAPTKGRVDGTVSSSDGSPQSGITVLLVPSGYPRSQMNAYRRAVTDQSGRFALQGIPPGDYQLFAASDLQINDFMNVDPSVPLEQGKSVHIENETTLTVQLEETADH